MALLDEPSGKTLALFGIARRPMTLWRTRQIVLVVAAARAWGKALVDISAPMSPLVQPVRSNFDSLKNIPSRLINYAL